MPSCLVPGMEGAEEQEAVWEEGGGMGALLSVSGVPSFTCWRGGSGLLLVLQETLLD